MLLVGVNKKGSKAKGRIQFTRGISVLTESHYLLNRGGGSGDSQSSEFLRWFITGA